MFDTVACAVAVHAFDRDQVTLNHTNITVYPVQHSAAYMHMVFFVVHLELANLITVTKGL